MADSESSYERTINDLVAKIEALMKPIREEMRMVNKLCVHAKLPPKFPDVETENIGGTLTFRRDQFFGKPLATVVREYLEARGPSDRGGLGAATVNEIFDALISGGYKPETDDEDNAKRGLRIALTKNSATFYRVPGGAYGLLEWYPNARPQKPDDDAHGSDIPSPGGKRKRGRPPGKVKKRRGRPPKANKAKSMPKSSADDEQTKAATESDPVAA